MDDFRFYDTLISVLRNSIFKLENVKKGLNLQDFVNNKISLRDVAQNVVKSEYNISQYKVLKELAKNYHFEDQNSHAQLRDGIKTLLSDLEVSYNNGIVTAKKKILILSQLLSYNFKNYFKEFHIICDILFINAHLPSMFRGKNLAIIANDVEVLKNCTFNLSGENLDPENNDDFIGKSSGNFSLVCKSIINSYLLTVILNGSDGKNGKDGENGPDGKDGQDATENSFIVGGYDWKVPTDLNKCMRERFKLESSGQFCYKSEVKTDDGLNAYVFIQHTNLRARGLILVKGSDGQPGEAGLPGEYGGKGGHSGLVSIECENPTDIKTFKKRGKDGKDGIGGLNGLHGKIGRDLWKYDKSSWSNPVLHGQHIPKKYMLQCGKSLGIKDPSWNPTWDAYVYVATDYTISPIQQTRERNSAKINRNTSNRDIAKAKSAIDVTQIKNKYAAYLNKNVITQMKDSRQYMIGEKERLARNESSDMISSKMFKTKNSADMSKSLEIYNELALRQTNAASKAAKNCEINSETFIARYSKFTSKNMSEIDKIFKSSSKTLNKQTKTVTASVEYKKRNPRNEKQKQSAVTSSINLQKRNCDPIAAETIESMRKVCLLFAEIYENLKSYNIDHDYEMEIKLQNLSDDALEEQVQFMQPLGNFVTGLENFDKHFHVDKNDLSKEILEYFNLHINNSKSTLSELVMSLLFGFIDDIDELADILKSCKTQSDDLLNKFDDSNSNDDQNELKIKLENILQNLFSNDKVIKFIKKDITEKGIKSLLYKEILAHKYGLKLIICIRDINDDIQAVQIHNDPDDLFFDDHETDKFEDIFVLENNNTFSLLHLNVKKYKLFKMRQLKELRFNSVALIMKDFNEGAEKYDDELVKSVKTSILNHKITNNIENCFQPQLSQENLIKMILEQLKEIAESSEVVDQATAMNENIIKKHRENIFQNLKLNLMILSNFNTRSILMAITTRLFNDVTRLSFENFSIIVRSITSILKTENSLVNWITFLIYGNEQQNWILELLMVKVEDILEEVSNDYKNKWMEMFENMKSSPFLYLFLEKLLDPDVEIPTTADMDKIIQNLESFELSDYQSIKEFSLLAWMSITTKKFWDKKLSTIIENVKMDDLSKNNLIIIFEDLKIKFGSKSESLIKVLSSKGNELSKFDVNKFLGYFISGEWRICDAILKFLETHSVNDWSKALKKHFDTYNVISNGPKIATYIKSDDETSKNIRETIDSIVTDVKLIFEQKSLQKQKKIMKLSESEIKEWIRNENRHFELIESLAIITRAFRLKTKNKLILRDTQLTAILTMWRNQNRGVLLQLSTGEGKTFTGVAFAILKVLNGEKLDIITSSSILAERDATDEENLILFDFFNIKVGHNCYEDKEKLREVYKNSHVVYGTLGNFQRDYLLTEFYEEDYISDHHFQNVLVDEVDNMLLDKGNNILYLSSDLPDIDEVEGVFTIIWNHVNQKFENVEQAAAHLNTKFVRKITLDTIYGIIDEDDIKEMNANIDAEEIINKLKQNKILDDENLIIEKVYNEARFTKLLLGVDETVAEKIKFVCREKIQAEKQFNIPKYLKSFVLLHLNEWIESAVRALFMQAETEYIVDRRSSGATINNNPEIIIVDLDTGTDMSNSQWDCGLHQFLELKHGCEMTLLSLKSVFISNVSFLRKYTKLYGMTGTLGNYEERKKITKIHQIDFVTIPRYLPRKFIEYPPIATQNESIWLKEISNETSNILKDKRSVLIICNTIKDTNIIQKDLMSTVKKLKPENLITFQRDTDEIKMYKLEPGYVIIATNLAGRGTDFKLPDSLKKNGGLHVILTYLPDNARIENQAFGRAARVGDKGSGRLIIQTEFNDSISKLKTARNQNELKRLDEISTYYKHFIRNEEDFFEEFQNEYKKIKDEERENLQIYQQNFKHLWTFWLDKNSKYLKDYNKMPSIRTNFERLKAQKKILYPVKRIELFKKLDEENFVEAKKILYNGFEDDLISFQYMKCYEILKSKQIDTNHKTRNLTNGEKYQIRKCIKMLENSASNRMLNTEIISNSKDTKNLPTMQSHEEQQKSINEIYDTLIDSLKRIIGADINPNTFHSAILNDDVIKNDLFEILMKYGFIMPPKVSRYFTDEDVRPAARNFDINFNKLKDFLDQNKGLFINSMNAFVAMLKRNFELPSREEFWEVLLQRGILKNEVEYAIIDLKTADNVDPSFKKLVIEKFKNEELPPLTSTSVLFTPFSTENEKEQELIIIRKLLESLISSARQQRLMETGVIRLNKLATFDTQKYKQLKNNKIFDNFDEICNDDFRALCVNYESIMNKLNNSDIKLLCPRTSTTYAINCDMMGIISFPQIFGDDLVYQEATINLIKSKFAYRLALDSLVKNLKFFEPDTNIYIHLHTNPHRRLLNELIDKMIIEQPKANKDKIDQIEEFLKNIKIDDFYKIAGLELSTPHDELTQSILQNNRKIIVQNADKVKENLKNCIQPLLNEELEVIEIILEPIDKSLPENQFVPFVRSKGLGWIIKVQQKLYSWTFFLRFIYVVLIGIAQVLVGAALMVLFGQTMIGSAFIGEGVGDLIFALLSLKDGYFTWNDYWNHKKESLIITGITFGVAASFKVAKWLYKVGKNATAAAKTAFNMTVKECCKYGGLAGVKEVGKNVLRVAVTTCGSALVKAGINYGVSMVIEYVTNKVTEFISNEITKLFTCGFWSHQIISTIDKMKEFFHAADLKQLIVDQFHKFITEGNKTIDQLNEICNYVNTALTECLSHGPKENQKLTVAPTIVSKLSELSLTAILVSTILDNLNIFLSNDIKKNQKIDEDKQATDKNLKEIKESTLNIMKEIVRGELKNSINRSVVQPLLTYGADKIIKNFRASILSSYDKRKENKFSKNVAEIEAKIDEHNYSNNAADLPKDILYKVEKVFRNTKSPENYRSLIQHDVPMNIVSVAAAAVFIENKIGCPVNIQVTHNGHLFFFGDVNNKGAKVLKINLVNGHYENSSDHKSDNNCFFHACADHLPELKDLTPKEFRRGIGNVMIENMFIKSMIKDPRKSFFIKVGFFGGAKHEVGSYGHLNYRNKKRKGKHEVDHTIPRSVYENTQYEMRYNAMPCMLFDVGIHRLLHSTSSFRICEAFRAVQRDFLLSGQYFNAELMALYDNQSAHLKYYKEVGYNEAKIENKMSKLRNKFNIQINYLENKYGVINTKEANYLIECLNNLSLTTKCETPFKELVETKFKQLYPDRNPTWRH